MAEVAIMSPARCAELVAAPIDRLRLAAADGAREFLPELTAANDLDLASVMAAAYLRNVYPDRPFSRAGMLAVFTYQSTEQIDRGLDGLVTRGYLQAAGTTRLVLTDAGRSLVGSVRVAADDAITKLWERDTDVVVRTLPLAQLAVESIDDGGQTFGVMAPSVTQPSLLSDCGELAELLTGLRFHRFDAHIAAWRAAGFSVAEVRALPEGPQRQAIEMDTNQRAATPYRALTPEQRLDLLAGLAALKG